MYLHGAPDDSGRGTYLIDLEALDKYGDEEVRRGRHPSLRTANRPSVWERGDPARAPAMEGAASARRELLRRRHRAAPVRARDLRDGDVHRTLKAMCDRHHQAPMRFCYDHVVDVRAAGIVGRIPNVMDARLQDPRRFDLQNSCPGTSRSRGPPTWRATYPPHPAGGLPPPAFHRRLFASAAPGPPSCSCNTQKRYPPASP